jgi:acyl-CoA reductase-like NAD-dependent aldehyde dehydrogenase
MRGKPLERTPQGYYVSPSIYVVQEPSPKSIYQDAEIFGPQVAFYKIKSIDEGAFITNESRFGLVASIYTQQKENYFRFLEQARVGSCHWNVPTTQVSYKMPFLGLKASGNLRPMGSFAGYQCTYPQSGLSLAEPFSFPEALPNE